MSIFPIDIESLIKDYKEDLDEYYNLEQQLIDFFEEHHDYFMAMEQKINDKVKLKETHQQLLEESNHLGFWAYQKLKYRLRKQLKPIKKEIKVYKKQILKKLDESGIKWKDFKNFKYDTFKYNWITKKYIIFSNWVFGGGFLIISFVLLCIVVPFNPVIFIVIILAYMLGIFVGEAPAEIGMVVGITVGVVVSGIIRLPVCLYNYLTRKTQMINIIRNISRKNEN